MTRVLTPPERLRVQLEIMRERGYTFSQAWQPAVSAALRDEPVAIAVFWRATWNREQRGVWACAYSKRRWPRNMRPGLEALDHDHSEPARATGALPVAA